MTVTPFRVIEQDAPRSNQVIKRVSLFDEAGDPVSFSKTGQDVPFTPVTTATAIGTAAKTTTSAEPVANTLVPIKFTNGNSVASPTVAFAGGAARSILLGGAAPGAGEITIAANGVGLFWFDGTALHQVGVLS